MSEIIEQPKETPTEAVIGIKSAIETAATDDTPIAITTNHGKQVNGDPSKAMLRDDDIYRIEFWYPLDDPRYQDMPQVPNKPYRKVTRTFKSEHISASKVLKLQSASLAVTEVFLKYNENGTIEFANDQEAIEFLNAVGSDAFEAACWKIISTVLGLEDDEIESIYTVNLLKVTAEIISNNLEFFQVDQISN